MEISVPTVPACGCAGPWEPCSRAAVPFAQVLAPYLTSGAAFAGTAHGMLFGKLFFYLPILFCCPFPHQFTASPQLCLLGWVPGGHLGVYLPWVQGTVGMWRLQLAELPALRVHWQSSRFPRQQILAVAGIEFGWCLKDLSASPGDMVTFRGSVTLKEGL